MKKYRVNLFIYTGRFYRQAKLMLTNVNLQSLSLIRTQNRLILCLVRLKYVWQVREWNPGAIFDAT